MLSRLHDRVRNDVDSVLPVLEFLSLLNLSGLLLLSNRFRFLLLAGALLSLCLSRGLVLWHISLLLGLILIFSFAISHCSVLLGRLFILGFFRLVRGDQTSVHLCLFACFRCCLLLLLLGGHVEALLLQFFDFISFRFLLCLPFILLSLNLGESRSFFSLLPLLFLSLDAVDLGLLSLALLLLRTNFFGNCSAATALFALRCWLLLWGFLGLLGRGGFCAFWACSTRFCSSFFFGLHLGLELFDLRLRKTRVDALGAFLTDLVVLLCFYHLPR